MKHLATNINFLKGIPSRYHKEIKCTSEELNCSFTEAYRVLLRIERLTAIERYRPSNMFKVTTIKQR